jgi:hypothetical protein
MLIRRPLLAILLSTAAVACTNNAAPQDAAPTPATAKEKAPAEAAPPTPTTSLPPKEVSLSAPKAAPLAGPTPEIKVIDAGAEPRAALRIHAVTGQEQPMNMTMTIGMAMNMGAGASPYIKMPPTEMLMSTKVTSVSSSGDFRYEFELTGVDVKAQADTQPEMVEAMRGAMAGIVGMRGYSVVSSRGEVREAEFELPPNAPAQIQQQLQGMRQSMQQIAVPFPEEAVGVGARWEVVAAIPDLNGLSLTQSASYELVGIEGETVRLKTSISQVAEPQIMKAPGMPPGAQVRLESMSSSGQGETTLNLGKLVPLAAKMQMGMKMAMDIDASGSRQKMAMSMDMGFELRGE